MKNVVEFFSKKKLIFKSLNEIDKALLKTRKKIKIYSSTDIDKNYHCIFIVEQKSRFLLKNAQDLDILDISLQKLENHNFKYKHLIISENICSKSVSYLEDRGWKFYHDFV